VRTIKSFDTFLRLIEKLRSENGCPWDRVQTIKSLKNELQSEAEEVMEAITDENYNNLKEELGDLFWVVALITQIAEDDGFFDMNDVLNGVIAKMVRRHPHVFGDDKASNAQEAKRIYYSAKRAERRNQDK
jgi:tetrapyrrole methylase family protein/MazG family protein